ncbi:MAG: DUF559 domain-containing protein [Nocardiopsaceae bacterium]|nr:DUF559 domain-containing protein [Nocardiopsaceae bacterium]
MAPRDIPDAVRESRVATLAGWEARGVPRHRLRTLVRSGDLVQTRYGVYATRAAMVKAGASPRLEHALEIRSAMVATGEDAVVSHQSAAILHGLDLLHPPPAGLVTFTRGRKQHRSGYNGIVFHSGTLPPRHVMKWRGIPTTTVLRTVIDLARILPFMDAVVVADSSFRADEGLTESEFQPVLRSCSGRPGAGRAEMVIDSADPNADSVFESCLRVLLREWGFVPPETHVTIHGASADLIVDFLFREQNTIVEADGMGKYKEEKDLREQFNRDRLLRDEGYKIVHVTWNEAFRQPQVVIGRIRKAFAAKGPF